MAEDRVSSNMNMPLSDEELTADDNWCSLCGDPREACLCQQYPALSRAKSEEGGRRG